MNNQIQFYLSRGVWGLLLWPYILTVSMPLDCKEEPGSLTRCPSISQEKLLDRVIHHAELIYRVSEESCSLFVSNSKINLCSFTFLIYLCWDNPVHNSRVQDCMLDEGTFTTTNNEQGLFQYDTLPDMLESVMRDYTLLSCFKKDAHKMETFLKLLKCRQADKYNCA
uniref:Somatolactin alpha n=1 Tax=Pundamilia nyererei TaxID=303518 RepID=A0A3B4G2U7_9CICH